MNLSEYELNEYELVLMDLKEYERNWMLVTVGTTIYFITMSTNHTWSTTSVGHAYKASAQKPAEAI